MSEILRFYPRDYNPTSSLVSSCIQSVRFHLFTRDVWWDLFNQKRYVESDLRFGLPMMENHSGHISYVTILNIYGLRSSHE
jgi:hypothetical protein